MRLNGPWRFHTGDNPRWADPEFDDSTWETIDLTAPPRAHDGDVGLSGYIPGWNRLGHKGYTGWAWYRLSLQLAPPPSGVTLALAGPAAVDDAYQIFVDGRLTGESGRFSHSAIPTVFSTRPRVFSLPVERAPERAAAKPMAVAMRVWMGPWNAPDPDAGGVHIAPSLGLAEAMRALNREQWQQTIAGYFVELVEAGAFIALALMAWALKETGGSPAARIWLCAALVFTALYRANQFVYFWGQFESIRVFEWVSFVLLIPLCMIAWMFAWAEWIAPLKLAWLRIAFAALGVLLLCGQLLAIPELRWKSAPAMIRVSRLCFAAIAVYLIYRAARRRLWPQLAAMTLVLGGQFARELSAVGIPGIWFPFGVGVSRTQYLYASFGVVLFALLYRSFYRLARSQTHHLLNERGER